jgi:hypothetical protein
MTSSQSVREAQKKLKNVQDKNPTAISINPKKTGFGSVTIWIILSLLFMTATIILTILYVLKSNENPSLLSPENKLILNYEPKNSNVTDFPRSGCAYNFPSTSTPYILRDMLTNKEYDGNDIGLKVYSYGEMNVKLWKQDISTINTTLVCDKNSDFNDTTTQTSRRLQTVDSTTIERYGSANMFQNDLDITLDETQKLPATIVLSTQLYSFKAYLGPELFEGKWLFVKTDNNLFGVAIFNSSNSGALYVIYTIPGFLKSSYSETDGSLKSRIMSRMTYRKFDDKDENKWIDGEDSFEGIRGVMYHGTIDKMALYFYSSATGFSIKGQSGMREIPLTASQLQEIEMLGITNLQSLEVVVANPIINSTIFKRLLA